jgi:hypothetical protein
MKRAVASLLLVALLGLLAVAHGQFLGHGQLWQFDAGSEVDPDKFIVGYNNKMGRDMALSNAATVRRELPNLNVVAVTMESNKADALKRNPNNEYVEYDYKRYLIGVRGSGTNSVLTSPNLRTLVEDKTYGIWMVQADKLSFNTTSNKKVCIIDSGYGLGHEDLPDNVTVTGAPNRGAGPWYENQSWIHCRKMKNVYMSFVTCRDTLILWLFLGIFVYRYVVRSWIRFRERKRLCKKIIDRQIVYLETVSLALQDVRLKEVAKAIKGNADKKKRRKRIISFGLKSLIGILLVGHGCEPNSSFALVLSLNLLHKAIPGNVLKRLKENISGVLHRKVAKQYERLAGK